VTKHRGYASTRPASDLNSPPTSPPPGTEALFSAVFNGTPSDGTTYTHTFTPPAEALRTTLSDVLADLYELAENHPGFTMAAELDLDANTVAVNIKPRDYEPPPTMTIEFDGGSK
jgi:hypothetical protein